MQLHAMAGGLGAIAARRHVAPPATSVLRLVLEHATAARIGAASNPNQLAKDERIGGTLDHRYQQAREGITDRHKGAHERAVARQFHAPCTGAAPEHAIDLGQCVRANVVRAESALGERAKHATYAPRIAQHGECAGGLLVRATTHARRPFLVQQPRALEPTHEALEIVEPVTSTNNAFRVYEIEPQPLRDERERVPITLVEV